MALLTGFADPHYCPADLQQPLFYIRQKENDRKK